MVILARGRGVVVVKVRSTGVEDRGGGRWKRKDILALIEMLEELKGVSDWANDGDGKVGIMELVVSLLAARRSTLVLKGVCRDAVRVTALS